MPSLKAESELCRIRQRKTGKCKSNQTKEWRLRREIDGLCEKLIYIISLLWSERLSLPQLAKNLSFPFVSFKDWDGVRGFFFASPA
jgi:hypothetical protein